MSESSKGTVLLIDGFSMAFRAFFALPVGNFATSTGVPTNAVHGFASMLTRLVKTYEPTHICVAMDVGRTTFRTEKLPSYKGTRDATPPEFEPQVPLLRELLAALGVAVVDREGYEADDVLATYARQGREAGHTVLVCSGDRDTLQLVNDSVTVLYPIKGVSELAHMTPAAVEAKYAVKPQNYPDLAALVGETSDNIPGVPGVGPKTAAKWVGLYGDLPGILAHAEDIGGKVGESLRANLDQVRLNREINKLVDDLELPLGVEDLRHTGGDAQAIHEICDALQFRSLRPGLLSFAHPESEIAPVAPARELTIVTGEVSAITSLSDPVWVYVDVRSGSDAYAIGVTDGSDSAWGIDLAELSPDQEQALGAWLADAKVPKATHAAKEAWHALNQRGYMLNGVVSDTQIAAFLVNPDQRDFSFAPVLERVLGVIGDSGTGAGELDLGLGDSVATTAAQSAAHVHDLDQELLKVLRERTMDALYRDIEVPLIDVLTQMEHRGISIDQQHLQNVRDESVARSQHAAEVAYASLESEGISPDVNLGSPKQLQEVLFNKLGMPKTKKIKTGYTTDAAALQDLNEKHPHEFLEALLAYRDSTKLTQIIDGLANAVKVDGRIHTSFVQTVAATGRLSSKDPNLQNIPIRTEEGHRIREAFVVGDGYETLLTADYSQIEMRIMAHLSGDEGLIAAFEAGEDLHRYVGARVFGVAPEDVDPGMRSQVKAMSYGLAYGLSAFGLARQLKIAVGAAQALMDDYFSRFGAVKEYLDGVVREATQTGYTETIYGRRRYLPDLTSTNFQRREIAQRAALNAPIQGSAADLMKKAMLGVEQRLRDERLASRQLLQVHDELVLEVAPGEREQVSTILVEEMQGVEKLSVPLDVNVGVGLNWRAAGH